MNSTTVFIILATLLSDACGNFVNLFNCNRTYFAHGVSLCQRYSLERLARSKDITCDSVYKKQVTCIDNHVHKCLEGSPYIFFKGAAVDLLKTITFNCGSVNQRLNAYILKLLGCKEGTLQNFERAIKCWHDFVTKYKANRNDPTLCKSLADAKKCVANATNHYCPTVNLEPDSCNPFCANGTDDYRPCPVLKISLTCKSDFYYEKEKECERIFVDALANQTNTQASCSTDVPKLKSCIKKQYSEKCFSPLVDDTLLENLANGVLSVTKGQTMFCNALNVTDRSAALRDIIPCGSDFYEKVESCTQEFREKFLANRKDPSLCRLYTEAKSCHHRLQAKHCRFPPSIPQITNDTYNPFCASHQSLVSCGLAMYFSWATLTSSLLAAVLELKL